MVDRACVSAAYDDEEHFYQTLKLRDMKYEVGCYIRAWGASHAGVCTLPREEGHTMAYGAHFSAA